MPPGPDRHQRTEKATPKRRHEARQRGQVARSMDISAFLGVAGASFILPTLVSASESRVLGVFNAALRVAAQPSASGAVQVLSAGMLVVIEVVLPLACALCLLGVAGNIAQVGLGLSAKSLTPKFSRISPKAGFKRIFSPQTGVSLVKQILKLAILAALAYSALRGIVHAVPASSPVPLISTVGIGSSRILGFVRTVALLGLAIGIGDFIYQKKHLADSLKMTKQQVKDEARERDGDPYLRNELRKRSYQIARRRVLQAVRTADVVVANPTHFAVALRYDRSRAPAPVVVAKGDDELARRIREEASRWHIPVVEDPPLARYLYATTEIGRQVPVEIFLAVARLLAFIFSLPPAFRAGSIHSYPHSHVPYDPVVVERSFAGAGASNGGR